MDEKEKEYYEADVNCYNCDNHAVVSISKGTTIETYRQGRICKQCGCFMDGLDNATT